MKFSYTHSITYKNKIKKTKIHSFLTHSIPSGENRKISMLLTDPLFQFKIQIKSCAKTKIKSISISARLNYSQQPEQRLSLSVLRFTFGNSHQMYCLHTFFSIYIFKAWTLLFGYRCTWIQRVVSTEMDRLPLRLAPDFESLRILQFIHHSAAGYLNL